MKKLIYLFLLSFSVLHAQFIEFEEGCSKNRFLGPGRSFCRIETNDSVAKYLQGFDYKDTNSPELLDVSKGIVAQHFTNNSKANYQKAYDCGNSNISEFLNVNFLSPGVIGQPFYIFNDFMYWMRKDIRKGFSTNFAPDAQFSGGGIFMIVLGVSPYLQELVASTKTCPEGQTMLVAQLKYNNGSSVTTWSQDAVCLAPTDKFKIVVSQEKDNTAPGYIPSTSDDTAQSATPAQGWGKESGPSQAVYDQAESSPRKIRLIKAVTQ